MTDPVLDTSAVLALMQDEPGADRVAAVLPGALMSAVSVAELVGVLADRGMPATLSREAVEAMGIASVAFDADQAVEAGALRPITRVAGLSLGDRACLALARSRAAPVLTADRAWARIAEDTGVTIEVLR